MAREHRIVRQPARRVPRPRGDGPPAAARRGRRRVRSPPARGWPERAARRRAARPAFPARAGMARPTYNRFNPDCRVPRPRGDGPETLRDQLASIERSPPARGWPDSGNIPVHYMVAFPARAGMARTPASSRGRIRCVPRPRGDGPLFLYDRFRWRTRSPPARGWPGSEDRVRDLEHAFPARAGMARSRAESFFVLHRVPRPRGDGPTGTGFEIIPPSRSPPARGWPEVYKCADQMGFAFPARAGMARPARSAPRRSRCVPRPRGDGPSLRPSRRFPRSRSPPARGWPVPLLRFRQIRDAFPARAGMARRPPGGLPTARCVPRPRGDGPSAMADAEAVVARSPPARGWPDHSLRVLRLIQAFPARAGMARITLCSSSTGKRVPRPRGDGDEMPGRVVLQATRSPPARGWPEPPRSETAGYHAFPARAGMARLASRRRRRAPPRSPPARGWPVSSAVFFRTEMAFPARAGMARVVDRRPRVAARVPRPRGDGPAFAAPLCVSARRSPPARGWPELRSPSPHSSLAFPARAGMARGAANDTRFPPRVPRPRGDGP